MLTRLWVGLVLLGAAAPAGAQAVPEGSQADRIITRYRRTPLHQVDPFRHVLVPHWGLVLSFGARAENNTLSFEDLGAFLLLDEEDEVLVGDIIDAFGLVPAGAGVGGQAQGENGVYLGGPFGSRLSLGFTAQTRLYGAFFLDDDATALFRDGNLGRAEFSLGESRASALATLEGGVHALIRLGPLGTVDGVRFVLGAGGRLVRPVAYAAGRSLIANGGRILVSGDSVAASVDVEAFVTPVEAFSEIFESRGSGIAADFLVRAEWPTNGVALEAMVANLGTIPVERVERRTLTVDVATTSLDTVLDVLDTLDLQVQDTATVDVELPRIVRFAASAWANRILQLDVTATLPTTGEFRLPMTVDVGSTWRLVRTIPLRVGLVLGGYQGVGYTAGLGIEGRHFLFRVSGESLGGLFGKATGAGGRFELGFLF